MNRQLIFHYLPGAIVVVAGIAIAMVAITYPLGTLLRPGPGFFPLVIAVLLALLGLGVLAEAFAAAAPSPRRPAPFPFARSCAPAPPC